MVSNSKYSLVPSKDVGEDKNLGNSAFDYSSAFSYKSAFDYNTSNAGHFKSAFDYGYPKPSSYIGMVEKDKKKKRDTLSIMGCLTLLLTGVSYIIIGITFPITLWFCLKRLQQWERLIVFRLGHLKGALGPGMVFVIPWLDRHTRVDMRTKAFSVPPQQLITSDNGIIEMGCEVKYRVSDVQQLTTSVTSPQHGLRSYGKTVLLNILTKHTVREMERDRLNISSEVLKELNSRVLTWGIEIGTVDLSTVNILKEPEAPNVLNPILNALGSVGSPNGSIVASPPGFGSPNSNPSLTPEIGGTSLFDFGNIAKMAGIGGFQGFSITGADKPTKSEPNGLNTTNDLIQLLDGSIKSTNSTLQPMQKEAEVPDVDPSLGPKSRLGRYLQSLVGGQAGSDLTHGVYRLQVEGDEGGLYFLFIANGLRKVVEGDMPKVTPDVSVVITKEDLTSVLEGTLSPLQAYLSGRLTVQGSIQMLMGLESLRQANTATTDKGDIFIV